MRKLVNIVWRSILVGLAYVIANIVVGAILIQLGWSFSVTTSSQNSSLLFITFLSGFLMGLTLGPVATLLSTSRVRSSLIWTSVIFLNLVSVTIEGYFFAPGLIQLAMVPRILVLQFLSTIVCSIAISFLFRSRSASMEYMEKVERPVLSWIWRFLLSSLAYLVFYYAFGAINYIYVTKPYYETHTSLAVPGFNTVIKVASVRAIVIILSILPLITALRLPQKTSALICGVILFVIGGIIPLSMQTGMLPPMMLIASGVEIFFQNFLTGTVAALLLARYKEIKVKEHVEKLNKVAFEEDV